MGPFHIDGTRLTQPVKDARFKYSNHPGRNAALTRRICPLLLPLCLMLWAAALPLLAQETPSRSAINYRERPRYPFEAQRLKSRPILDGTIGENEWDPLYTIGDGPVKGTVFVNWDADFLYFGARTDKPAWILFDLDTSADGWLRGADNLELVVAPLNATGQPVLTARLLDAASSKDAPVWNDRVVDPKSIQIVQKAVGEGQVVELAIPKGIAALNPRPNAVMACRADFLPDDTPPVPTAPYEPHLLVDISLVESRAVAAPGISPRFMLDDNKLIPGQNLRATFELLNQTDENYRIRAVTWQGEGPARDILKSIRDPNVPTLMGLKSLRLPYSSVLPESTVPGFYQLTVEAQLENGRSVVSTASFSVVEPFSIQILVQPEPISILGRTQITVKVEIQSAVPNYAQGEVELEVPANWEIHRGPKRRFYAEREDGVTRPSYTVTLPSTTQAGNYILHATVTWRGKSWKAHRTVTVNRGAETEPPRQP